MLTRTPHWLDAKSKVGALGRRRSTCIFHIGAISCHAFSSSLNSKSISVLSVSILQGPSDQPSDPGLIKMKSVSDMYSLGVTHTILQMDALFKKKNTQLLRKHYVRIEILELSVNRIEKYFCARKRTDTLILYHEGSAIVSCRQKFKKKKCVSCILYCF